MNQRNVSKAFHGHPTHDADRAKVEPTQNTVTLPAQLDAAQTDGATQIATAHGNKVATSTNNKQRYGDKWNEGDNGAKTGKSIDEH